MEELIHSVAILSAFSSSSSWLARPDVSWHCVREDVGLTAGDKIDAEGLNRWLALGFKFPPMALDLNSSLRGSTARW